MSELGATGVHDEVASRRDAQDDLVIAGLAGGLSYDQAGSLAHVSGRTVARRMQDPVFARRVADRRGEQVVALAGVVTSLSSEAVAAIRSCLEDDSPRVRMAAGKLILDLVIRFRHGYDLEASIAEIRGHLGLDS